MQRATLITGATGFLGKVLLKQLLRRSGSDLERVYVLIRPREGVSAYDRFQREVRPSACFAGLDGDWVKRVGVVEGVLEEPGLRLDASARDELSRAVTHVLHTAASVKFDLPLAEAERSNVRTSLNLLDFARDCPRLRKLVSVSTAYVTPHPGADARIGETLAPLPGSAEAIQRAIREGGAREADLLARSGHPNTYTFTKCLAEHLLVARRGDVPLSIVRPSIISASWRDPFPGWIDSAAAFAGFVILVGSGYMRAVLADRETRLDLVPVDEVAARVLEAGEDSAPEILHVVAGPERSPSIQMCWEEIRDHFRARPAGRRPAMRYLGPSEARVARAHALHHRLATAPALLGSARLRRRRRRLLERIEELNRVFPYFTRNTFRFDSSRPFDDPDFEPRRYVRTVCEGIQRHILRPRG